MEITLTSTEETKQLAKEIATSLDNIKVIALYGDLGSGKTTFTRFLLDALGFDDRVQSPTFILHRVYFKKRSDSLSYFNRINHFDLYRLQNINEILDMGIIETLAEDKTLAVLEWPELIEDVLSKDHTLKIKFEYLDLESRRVIIE